MKITVDLKAKNEKERKQVLAFCIAAICPILLIMFFRTRHKVKKNNQVFYVTPNGEKYHASEICAGENAKQMKYRKIVKKGYAKCANCVK